MSKKTALMVAAGACLLLLIALGVLMQGEDGPDMPADLPAAGEPADDAVAEEPKLLKLENYIHVEGVEGVSGKGVLKYSIEGDAFAEDAYGPLPELTEDNLVEALAARVAIAEKASKALDCVQFFLSQETGLKNGDTVTVEARFVPNVIGQTFPFKVQNGSITYTVSGLQELKPCEPFAEELLQVSFSGYDGSGRMTVEYKGDPDIFGRNNYKISADRQLANGDQITITYKADAFRLETRGYAMPEQTEKVYTVSGLTKHHELADGIPAEGLEAMKTLALDMAKKDIDTMVNDATVRLDAVWYLQAKNDREPFSYRADGLEFSRGVVVLVRADSPTGGGLSWMKENWYRIIFQNCRLDDQGQWTWDTGAEDLSSKSGISKDEAHAWVRDKFSDTMTLTPLG